MSNGTTVEPAVTIDEIGPCRKKITIEIPASAVAGALEEKFASISGEAQLPGFRAGRVPKRLLERRFGPAIRDEAKQQLVAQAYQDAVQKHELRVLGDPEGGEELADLELSASEPVRFSLEVEVAPDFELPDVEGIEVKKPLFDVTDEMVDRELERMAMNEGSLEPQEKAAPGDYAIGHGLMVKDDGGETIHDIDGAVIQIPPEDADGRGMILGVLVEDLASQIGQPSPGETLTVKTTGPEQHEIESIRGEALTVTFEVREVNRIAPAPIEELAQRFGMEDEQQLREAIKLRLNQRVMVEQQAAMRQQVARRLLDNVTLELPEQITQRQAARNVERQRLELMHRGETPEAIEQRMAELRASSGDAASRELKLFFILDRIAAQNDVQITEAEVNGRIAQIAAERGERPDKVRDELIQGGHIQGIAQQIREHKTLDSIVANAKVDEVSADEYRAWAESQRGELADSVGGGGEAKKKSTTSKKSSSKKSSSKKSSGKKASTKSAEGKKKSSTKKKKSS